MYRGAMEPTWTKGGYSGGGDKTWTINVVEPESD